jgi:lysophospholipase L1-like esterase
MPTVLCYGDSNTWGHDPATNARLPAEKRWPGVLRRGVPEATVIEEGLSGRTTILDDPFEDGRNGLTYLVPCLASHRPLDVVILMLGTNDVKGCFPLDAPGIAAAAARLVDTVRRSQAGPGWGTPEVLLVAPPPVTAPGPVQELWGFSAVSVERARRLGELYRAAAESRACAFLDAGAVVSVSPLDGVHLDQAAHERLGTELAARVRALVR